MLDLDALNDDCNDDCADQVPPAPAWPYKWQRILASFLTGRSWHALEAVRELGTSCLHSDVSGLEARGLKFLHERTTAPGYGGSQAAVVRYTIRSDSIAQARALLGLATHSGQSDDDVRDYRRASGS